MNYTLDTNIVTALMKNDAIVRKRLQDAELRGKQIFITGISYYEAKRGLLAKPTSATTKLKVFDAICRRLGILLLDSRAIFDRASEIYADLKQRGKPIGDADILIAAIALTRNLVVVSDNTRHFSQVAGIVVENWLKV